MEQIKQLQKIIDESHQIVFFGGAGVSTESGIPDFRSSDGLFMQDHQYPPEKVVSHSFFREKTEAFYDFYKDNMIYLEAKPNAAHLKLAELEKKGKLEAIVTQNIDGLHQLAGSKKVYELHGSVQRNYCEKCGNFFDATYVKNAQKIPRCNVCKGRIKPDVVLYEEALSTETMQGAIRAIGSADTLIIGGTSLVVYPAASFVDYFSGKNLVVINKSVTDREAQASLVVHGAIGEVLTKILV